MRLHPFQHPFALCGRQPALSQPRSPDLHHCGILSIENMEMRRWMVGWIKQQTQAFETADFGNHRYSVDAELLPSTPRVEDYWRLPTVAAPYSPASLPPEH